jgi:hypothetical protein
VDRAGELGGGGGGGGGGASSSRPSPSADEPRVWGDVLPWVPSALNEMLAMYEGTMAGRFGETGTSFTGECDCGLVSCNAQSPGGEVLISCSTYQVKPFYLSSETVLPIKRNRSTYQVKPFCLSNSTCTATSRDLQLRAPRRGRTG